MEEYKKPTTPDANANTNTSSDQNDKVMALLSYIGILWLVPYLAAKDSKLAQYHANQGCVLFIFSIVAWFVAFFLSFIFYPISFLVWGVILVLAILGIINALNGELKPLPVIGNFKILK